jgi:hypothetical protein
MYKQLRIGLHRASIADTLGGNDRGWTDRAPGRALPVLQHHAAAEAAGVLRVSIGAIQREILVGPRCAISSVDEFLELLGISRAPHGDLGRRSLDIL